MTSDGHGARPAKAGFAAAAIDEEAANIAIALSARKGYLDGRALAEVFAWLRPDRPGLALLGEQLRRRQIARGVRRAVLERRHHPDGGRAAPRHGHDGAAQFAGDARRGQHARHAGGSRTTDDRCYVVAGIADHISPWQACYRSARLLGSKDVRFVLSSSGHIASLVNPPGNPRASYRVGGVDETDPAAWVESAEQHTDSWWPDFVSWFAERSGKKKDAPGAGRCRHDAASKPAPGSYVREM